MNGLNRVMLVGRLGKDPEVRYTQKGTPVADLAIATNRNFKNENGEKEEHTEWHNVVVWGKQAEICQQFLNKGRLVYAEGRLETQKWNDKDGNPRKSTKIMASAINFLDSNKKEEEE